MAASLGPCQYLGGAAVSPFAEALVSNDPRAADLLPCPFCGSPAALRTESDHHGGYFSLGCSRDGCCAARAFYTEPAEDLGAAVAAWNTRTPADRDRRNWELMCLRLVRQLPRENAVRKDAEGFLARHGSGIGGTLRGEYPAADFGELKGSPLDDLPAGRLCPKCGGQMAHYRLKGYRCLHCD